MRRFLVPLLLLALPAFAQQGGLHLRTGLMVTAPLPKANDHFHRSRSEKGAARIHRFVLFDRTLNAGERDRLTQQGVRFLEPLPPHGWVISFPAELRPAVLIESGATGILEPTGRTKLAPGLAQALEGRGWRARSQAVLVQPWPDAQVALPNVPVLKERPLSPQGARGAVVVQLKGRELRKLLDHPSVQWVEQAPANGEPEDLRGQTFHRVNPIAPVAGGAPGLDGSGVTTVVNDDGFVGPHIDMKGRTQQASVAQDLNGDHGDMVAGILGGAGNLDPRNVGMAPGTEVIVRPYQASLPNTVTLHQNDGAVIFNSSYSDGCNAGYTAVTQQVDEETVDNPAIIQVFSAGNNGGQDCGYGAGTAWGNITGGHKIAKNCIATANLNDNGIPENSSSRGPSADGRLKPDISAYGNSQISLAPGDLYAAGGGTSAASPGVAGTLAVLYQGWRQLHSNDPSSGLMKALLMNTADDLGNDGPDYTFGWGRLNAARAWQAIVEERFMTGTVDQGQQTTHTINVPAGAGELRVMLYWMDPEASLQAATALVNDLDLVGSDPNSQVRMPWSLSNAPNASALAAPAVPGEDHVNNVEQVAVMQPTAGNWTFTVSGTDVPEGPQAYHLLFELMPEGPRVTYPLAGVALATDETHRFRWDALEGTSSFNLSMSLDSGLTWNTYAPVPADRRHYDVGIGNVVVTHALFRVERDGLADIAGPFTLMPVATGLAVPLNCVDSAQLTWVPVPQASGYIVHKLGAQYMDSVGFTTDTSFMFTGLQAVHEDWFAVTALAPNGVRARRSLGVKRPQQLVNCQTDRDLAAVTLRSPAPLVIECQPPPGVQVVVRNEGLQVVQDLTVGFRVDNGPVTTEAFSIPIAPGDSAVITMATPLTGLAPDGTSTLRVWATALNESFTPNDTLTAFVLSVLANEGLPFQEDGEGLDVCATGANCTLACADVGSLFNGRNGIDDDIDWRVDTAGTSTPSTGPEVDHTLGTDNGRYFYLEASGNCSAREALLLTPCVTLPTQGAYSLGWWHHMYGSGQGELHIDLIVDGALLPDIIPPYLGDQGDQWHQGTVYLAGFAGSTVSARFRGIVGANAESDLALDDISFATATAINERTGTEALQLHPTGQSGVWMLTLEEPMPDALVRVLDPAGRTVQVIPAAQRDRLTIDLSAAAAGVYVVRLESGRTARHGRVVRP